MIYYTHGDEWGLESKSRFLINIKNGVLLL